MASKIDVFNMALAHIGASTTVADEQEHSPERVACSRFWETCRDTLFSYQSVPWRFAKARVLLADLGSPPAGWGYRYRYPNDCITAIEVTVTGRAELFEKKAKFQVEHEASGRVIVCDIPEAELVYVKRVEAVERWPGSFVEAMAYRLAAMIAMPLKKETSLRNDLLQIADQFIQMAAAASLNESVADNAPPSIYEQELHA